MLVVDTPDIRIRYEETERTDFLVVTFNQFDVCQGKNVPAFGENMLQKAGLSRIHITTEYNTWYQNPELSSIADLIGPLQSRYAQVIGFGRDMGGYAAIKFSGLLKATRTVAVSPHYSVDPHRVHYASRYEKWARQIQFTDDQIGNNVNGRLIVAHTGGDDRLHARDISWTVPAELIGPETLSSNIVDHIGLSPEHDVITKTLLFGDLSQEDMIGTIQSMT